MKNFIQVLEDALIFGHTVSFKKEGQQLSIRVQKKISLPQSGVLQIKTIDQMIPMDSHFNEGKIADCIEFQINKLR